MNITTKHSIFPSFSMGRDVNGNKVCRVRPQRGRGFSIQTNGNLPETDRNGICDATKREVEAYVSRFGTERQKASLS
jgi:hypothetical protein